MTRARGCGALVLAVLWVLSCLFWAVPASADDGEHITSYDVSLTVRPNGALGVSETIIYDFGTNARHGIFRAIPTKVPYDKDNFRIYPLTDVRVSSPDGASAEVSRSESAGVTTLRIGDPDATVTGAHTYVVAYTVQGALNRFSNRDELYWNAIGTEWAVPIDSAAVHVATPSAIRRHACFAGFTGDTKPCASERVSDDPTRADFTQPSGLPAHSAFTVAIALPRTAVAATGPILSQRWTLRRALTPTQETGAVAAGILVLGAAVIMYLLGTLGRDRRFVGQTPGLLPASGTKASEEAVPVVSHAPVAVAFTPPAGLRPGQVGTLLDEQANVVDVTATIVDLAVRGYLRIDELPRAHWFTSRDWQLVKMHPDEAGLLPYESELFRGLFDSGETVKLSALKKKFAARLAKVQTLLYLDVTNAGWFRGRPDKVRGRWKAVGFVVTLGAAFLAYKLFKLLHWGPVAISLVIVGLALLLTARRMPSRTARGTAVLAQARGFREYIRTAEADQLRFEESADIFSRYLPYAIVFGEAERWVSVFGPLAAASAGRAVGAGPLWYSGPNGWDASHFSDSLTGFTSSVSSTIAASTASSSGGSGFSGGSSGGGGGGGGGGSW